MSITVNGQSRVPPGFRFHPTEEELLTYYLRKKVACEKIDLDVIRDVDLNKLEPWDIQEKCKIGSTPQNDWYFFSHKDKKYPTGTRTNRATTAGFWKATGRDKVIQTSLKRIGMRKTLVFYKGRAPHGQKSDWIMHEYRLVDDHHDYSDSPQSINVYPIGELIQCQEDGWVVCRVFKKKNYNKVLDHSLNSLSAMSCKERVDGLDQILQCMGKSCKRESSDERKPNSTGKDQENIIMENSNGNSYLNCLLPIDISNDITTTTTTCNGLMLEGYVKFPAFENPSFPNADCPPQIDLQSSRCINYYPTSEDTHVHHHGTSLDDDDDDDDDDIKSNSYKQQSADTSPQDWATLDRLVASHLNGQTDGFKQLTYLDDMNYMNEPFGSTTANRLLINNPQNYTSGGSCNDNNGELDLWGALTAGYCSQSGSDHL